MIEVKNVSKEFKDVKAVNDVSLTIETDQFIGLLGPNGAGKSTLIKMMICLLDPTGGEIYFDGIKLTKDAMVIKKELGVVSQHINLDKELTVEENMIFAGKLYHMKKADINRRMDEIFELLNLNDIKKRQARYLSGGIKRKLMIAKALIHDPTYIFLDEPTVGIDVHARKEIWKFLKQYHKRGKTIILTTHYIEEAEELCEKIFLINKGEIFKSDTSEGLINELGIYKVEDEENNLYFFDTLDQAKEKAANIDSMTKIDKTTLEDIFYFYTKEENTWG